MELLAFYYSILFKFNFFFYMTADDRTNRKPNISLRLVYNRLIILFIKSGICLKCQIKLITKLPVSVTTGIKVKIFIQ